MNEATFDVPPNRNANNKSTRQQQVKRDEREN